MNHVVTIFTASDIKQFLKRYPEKENSLERHLLEADPTSLIYNLKTTSIIINKGSFFLFGTVNHKEYGNTHICSPYNVYIGYARESAKHFKQYGIRLFIYSFTSIFGQLFKLMQINRVIQLNNTLSTLNLYPQNTTINYSDIVQAIIKKYPKHAIIWPRINLVTDKNLYHSLKTSHFNFLLTKTVHIFDVKRKYMAIKSTKRDFSLLKQSNYTVVNHDNLNADDMGRLQQLYEMLFIKKHSACNPQYTIKYFEYCHRYRWFEFIALRNTEGVIDAFCSQTKMGDIMICGPSGYDTQKPQKLGLYRMIMWLNLNAAWQKKCLYNMGSGNEAYKLNRGSIRQLEYNAVYYSHLSFFRCLPWMILTYACAQFSKRVLEKNLL